MTTDTIEAQGVRVAVEGCGHGTLDAIYASVAKSCEVRGWTGVDLLIIGGDFQALRNAADLTAMAVPVKYRQLGDFHAYYSGARTAPCLTIFVAGNHEASSHLWELYYGGWVAPNIYYIGAANVLRFGPLRIAGMSGIWKGFDYRKTHHERLPFNENDVRSFYHVREIDVRKLLLLSSQVDIGISHDWPRGIEKHGNSESLFEKKRDFRQESIDGTLGSVAAEYVLNRLRPPYWFSAHLHVKYAAIKRFSEGGKVDEAPVQTVHTVAGSTATENNPDEIDLDMDDGSDEPAAKEDHGHKEEPTGETNEVSEELKAQLPESFFQPKSKPRGTPGQPVPPGITNKEVRFLALDKCLPGRSFLQLCDILPRDASEANSHPPRPTGTRYRLQYDPEWLAINRVFHDLLVVGDPQAQTPPDLGEEHYASLIEKEQLWVSENIVKKNLLDVPENFQETAPPHVPGTPEIVHDQPEEYTSPQTAAFCQLLGVPNIWHASSEDRQARQERGPLLSQRQDRGGGRGRGGRGGRGRWGRGRGRARGR